MLFSEKRFSLFGSMLRPSICLWTEPCRGSGASGGGSRTNAKLRRAPERGTIMPADNSFFPRWSLKTEGIVMPDERLPTGQTVSSGLQHVVAMFGATVLAPILMGFDPNVSILFSGIATLIFFVVVGGRVPSYLGSSFAFIGPVLVATGASVGSPNPNIPPRARRHHRGRRALFPDRPRGADRRAPLGRAPDAAGGDRRHRRRHRPRARADRHQQRLRHHARQPGGRRLSPAGSRSLTVLAVGIVAVYAPGMWRRLPVLVGGAVGYLAYLICANGLGFGQPDRFHQGRRRRRGSACRPSRARSSTCGPSA